MLRREYIISLIVALAPMVPALARAQPADPPAPESGSSEEPAAPDDNPADDGDPPDEGPKADEAPKADEGPKADEAPKSDAADDAKPVGKLEVRIKDGVGEIFIDGEKVGSGDFKGDVPVGEHGLKVTREGYDSFTKTVVISETGVVSETVALRKNVAGDELAERDEGDWTFDGLYGGLQLHGMFVPANTGHTLDTGCDTVGASSCDAGTPAGGALAGYVGYAFAPLGFELMLLAGSDVVQPVATFDGKNGSDINPLVASPARDEEFLIARFGGGGALRLRVLVPIDRFRITGALGAGVAYRYMILARDTTAADGGTNSTSDDGKGYVTPVLSMEVAGQVRLGGTTSLAVGFNLWLEHAGSDLATVPETNTLLTGGSNGPAAIATPSYDMATGTQVFLGPFLGVQFGP